MPTKRHTLSVPVTPAEKRAISEALALRRRRTGENVTVSGLSREGLRRAVEEEGVVWPTREDKP